MNQPDGFDRRSFLMSMVFSAILIMLGGGMAIYVLSDSDLKSAYMLSTAVQRIEERYAGTVDWSRLMKSARDGMFDRLDRYSDFYEPSGFEALDEEMTGGYSGIGVTIVANDEGLLIVSVRENGPSALVGLRPGDIIIGADTVSFAELRRDESTRWLRGPDGTEVLVKIKRPATGEIFETVVKRSHIPFEHIPFAGLTPDSILYIRLLDFDPGATDDLKAAIDSLMPVSGPRPKGLILDLSGNPGGLFYEAYETADVFLKKGMFMVGTNGRTRWNDREYYSSGSDLTGGLPMAVIVDRGSASSAEIVSGTLQRSGRAMLVGDTTFGKGLVQGFVRFPDGDGLKLTISRYFFDGPIYLNDFDSMLHDTGHGLVTDYYLKLPEINGFQRALENQLIMRQFVGLHLDQLLPEVESGELSGLWIDSLSDYAFKVGFEYSSVRTAQAIELRDLMKYEKSSKAALKQADQLIALSQKVDRAGFEQNQDYILSRLKQIAFESGYGNYRTYRDIIVRTRPDILQASELLLGEK